MRRELLLVLLERQDVSLAGVGGHGQLQHGRVVVRRLVGHLGRGEVEAAEPLGPHHDRMPVVSARWDPVHSHLEGRNVHLKDLEYIIQNIMRKV